MRHPGNFKAGTRTLGSLPDLGKVSLGTLSPLGNCGTHSDHLGKVMRAWQSEIKCHGFRIGSKRSLEHTDQPLKAVKYDFGKRLPSIAKTRFDLGKTYFAHLEKISRNPLFFVTRPWENPISGKTDLGKRVSHLEKLGKALSKASQLPSFPKVLSRGMISLQL